MLSQSFISDFNREVKLRGGCPLNTAYKRIFVLELKNTKYDTRMRVNSKWYAMTPENERILFETLTNTLERVKP